MEEIIRNNSGELSRRRFLSFSAKSLLGVGFIPTLAPHGLFAQDDAPEKSGLTPTGRKPTARKVIYLYMSGRLRERDSWVPEKSSRIGVNKPV